MARALNRVTSLKSLNGCAQYTALRTGDVPRREMRLDKEWELGMWVVEFLERSASTLTKLDLRCKACRGYLCVGGVGGGHLGKG